SLILIGLTFRTFSAAVSVCVRLFVEFIHETFATRSPLNAAVPDVTLKAALTLAPGATGSPIVTDVLLLSGTIAVHCLFGTVMLNLTPVAGADVVFVNVTVVSCEDPGVNVCSPGGVAAEVGERRSGATPYFAATTLACTN